MFSIYKPYSLTDYASIIFFLYIWSSFNVNCVREDHFLVELPYYIPCMTKPYASDNNLEMLTFWYQKFCVIVNFKFGSSVFMSSRCVYLDESLFLHIEEDISYDPVFIYDDGEPIYDVYDEDNFIRINGVDDSKHVVIRRGGFSSTKNLNIKHQENMSQ